jgi:hypothetical protein
MTLRRDSSDWLTRMRCDNARSAELSGMRCGCDGRMALIVVERKRRVFRRGLHILRLRGRRAT